MRRLLIGVLLVVVVSLSGVVSAFADSSGASLGQQTAGSYPGEMPMEKQAPLPVGTVITTQNWEQYKDYMPGWMQIVFSGQYFYKLAPDQQIVVGPTIPKTLPKAYVANTEKYSGQVRLKELPEGATLIQNYTAGLPFPNPAEPDLGGKLLWNLWYRYYPRLEVADTLLILIDQYNNRFREEVVSNFQRLGHLSEPGLPIFTPEAPNIDLALYTEIVAPEQSKYTVGLILYFLDPTRVQETWSFVPSLRRPLRLSASARCAPSVGTDAALEDQRAGFNLLVSDMVAQPVAHKMTLMMNHLEPKFPTLIDFLDPKLFHQWGVDQGVAWPIAPNKWELEETYIIDVKRVPSKLAGYCYGNRRVNLDAVDYQMSGEELSDMNGKPWKLFFMNKRPRSNSYGDLYETGIADILENIMDLQNRHYSFVPIFHGRSNSDAPKEYWDTVRYASPTGLLEIMK
jgi:Protein of unknown function (DUF1329)